MNRSDLQNITNNYFVNNIGLNEFLSREEMKKRQALGYLYFRVGSLYKVRKNFMALSKKIQGRHKAKLQLKRGEILFCFKSTYSSYIGHNNNTNLPPTGIIEFLFKEEILRYVTDAHSLCCLLDLVELKNNE